MSVLKSLAMLLLTSTLIEICSAIKCYSCDVNTCNLFQESSEFEQECEHSTMCLKTIYPYRLNNGEEIESMTRGCAQQHDKGMVLKNKKWVATDTIVDLPSGCNRLKKDSDTIYCLCKGDRCNGAASSETSGYHTDAMAVIFMFNAIKYLRSIGDY